VLYLSALLIGASHVFYNIAVQNLIGTLSTTNEARTRNFSNFSLVIASGGFVGPLIAGVAIDTVGHAIAYLMIAAGPATTAAIMFSARRRLDALRGGKSKGEEEAVYAVGLLSNVPLRRTLITSGIILTAIDLFQFYMPIYGHAIGLSAVGDWHGAGDVRCRVLHRTHRHAAAGRALQRRAGADYLDLYCLGDLYAVPAGGERPGARGHRFPARPWHRLRPAADVDDDLCPCAGGPFRRGAGP